MKRLSPPTPNRWRNFYHFSEIDSTNEEAIRFIGRGVSSGIVVADRQTAGRGREGKIWLSPDGNLYVSFFERTVPEQAITMAKVAGLAAFDTIAGFIPHARVRLKWPNDILVGDKKLCGILIQHLSRGRDLFTVTGIGINIKTPDKTAFSWHWEPTSLEEEMKTAPSRTVLLRDLTAALSRWRGAAIETIDSAYAGRISWMLNAHISWISGGKGHEGQVLRFSDAGRRIIVRTRTGQEELAAGDITSIMLSQP